MIIVKFANMSLKFILRKKMRKKIKEIEKLEIVKLQTLKN